MFKFKETILMLCFIISGALCYASGVARTESKQGEDGVSIGLIEKTSKSSSDKSGSILPTINGHVLTVVFTENLGQVAVEITTASGASVEYLWVHTPNGLQTYLPLNGDYVITFTLPDGDEYYGEFTVTD